MTTPPLRLSAMFFPFPRLLAAVLVLGFAADAALAQTNPRSTFPGRRIGGGTRGECTARLLVHLVPPSSVYAPGSERTVGLLEGPAAQPQPLRLEFEPLAAAGPTGPRRSPRSTRDLPPSPSGITLFSVEASAEPTVWSSSYRCGSEQAPGGADPLAFVETAAPPALSLVVNDTTAADRSVREALARLRQSCGGTVPRQEVARAFGLADLITAEWPQSLPVRCL